MLSKYDILFSHFCQDGVVIPVGITHCSENNIASCPRVLAILVVAHFVNNKQLWESLRQYRCMNGDNNRTKLKKSQHVLNCSYPAYGYTNETRSSLLP